MNIAIADAERVWTEWDGNHFQDYGSVTIQGVEYAWWASLDCVWFYDDPNKSGEDTCARFEVEHVFSAG